MSLRSAVALTLTLLAGGVVTGCGSNSPATPDGQPLVFTGQLGDGETATHVLNLVREGTIRIALTDVTPVLIQLPPSGELGALRLGVGLGDLTTGTCQRIFTSGLAEGQSVTVLLTDPARCLEVFDDGSLPEDAVVAYTVTVSSITE